VHVYACLLACLDWSLTVSHFQLLFCMLRHALIQKGLKDSKDVNHEQPTSMATTRTETTRGHACSVSRVVEVTTWQSVDAVCLCCLTHGSCHWTQTSSGLSVSPMPKRMAFICPCHLHMTRLHYALARPDSQFLCCTRVYFFVWYSAAWVSVTFC